MSRLQPLHYKEETMIERRWVQIGGLAGVLGCLVLVGSAFTVNNTLSSNSTTDQIQSYLTSNKNGVLAETLLTVIAMALFLWFTATLVQLLHERDPRSPLGFIVLVSGLAMAITSSLDGLPLTALVFLSKQGTPSDPSLVRAFYDLENGIIMPGVFGFLAAIFLAAFGIAVIRHVFASAWLGWLSVGFAALAVVGGAAGLMSTGGGTSIFGFFPLGSVLVILITSIFMVRYPIAEPQPEARTTSSEVRADQVAPSRT
jgi:hypothetical protein